MAKKITLHITILLLAAVSLICWTNVAYIEVNNVSKDGLEEHYKETYMNISYDAVQYAVAKSNGEEIYGNEIDEDGMVFDGDFVYYIKLKDGDSYSEISNVDVKDSIFTEQDFDNIVTYSKSNNAWTGDEDIISYLKNNLNYLDDKNQIEEMRFAVDNEYDNDGSLAYYHNQIKDAPTKEEYELNAKNEANYITIAVGSIVLSLVPFFILMVLAGHKRKNDKASLCEIDRAWLDVVGGVIMVAIICAVEVLVELFGHYRELFEILVIVVGVASVELIILICESFMRRFKTHQLMSTTLTGKILKWIKKIVVKIIRFVKRIIAAGSSKLNLTTKVILFAGAMFGYAFVVFMWCAATCMDDFFDFLVLLMAIAALIAVMCGVIWNYFDELEDIVEGTRKITEGNMNYQIQREIKFPSNKKLKESVNSIGEGLNHAVEKSMKDERMRTELIANVSHDLKTPLTSIINYVDLLKEEGLESENAQKYLNILDQKSMRLKHLTEDLVEVSKLTSGVITLDREKLDIVQLINQSLAEFDDKFSQRNISVIKTISEQPIWVMADGRKTWRAFDNLYSNIYKYAMSGTRAYIDVVTNQDKVTISVKNISDNPLNFKPEELFERFVRGDDSRTTEGNGLGLSIAKSIIEKQDGHIEIFVDGDLFKVEITMDKIK